MTTRTQMQNQLDHARIVRSQLDDRRREVNSEVHLWLATMSTACLREARLFGSTGMLSDKDLADTWEILDEKIGQLRQVEQSTLLLNTSIEEMIQQLADEELWK